MNIQTQSVSATSTDIFIFLAGIVIAMTLAEISLRAFNNLFDKNEDVSNYKLIQQHNDAYEIAGESRENNTRFPRMRYSTYLGYYPLKNSQGMGYQTNQYGFRYSDDFSATKEACELRCFRDWWVYSMGYLGHPKTISIQL